MIVRVQVYDLLLISTIGQHPHGLCVVFQLKLKARSDISFSPLPKRQRNSYITNIDIQCIIHYKTQLINHNLKLRNVKKSMHQQIFIYSSALPIIIHKYTKISIRDNVYIIKVKYNITFTYCVDNIIFVRNQYRL